MGKPFSRPFASVRSRLVITASAFALFLVINTRLPIGQAQSTAVTLVVVASEAENNTLRFGDTLTVQVTIQNQGNKPVTIPYDALSIKNEGWAGFPGFSSGFGESRIIHPQSDARVGFVLSPGKSVVMSAEFQSPSVGSMGPMSAQFVIETQDDNLIGQLDGRTKIPASYKLAGKRAELLGLQWSGDEPGFEVQFDVAPSNILASAWSGKSDGDLRKLQNEFEKTILIAPEGHEIRELRYAENSLVFMGCHSLPLLRLEMKNPDAAFRQRAISAISRLDWNTREFNSFIADLEKKNYSQPWKANVAKCDEEQSLRESIKLIVDSLADQDAEVRADAISALSQRASYEKSLRDPKPNDKQSSDNNQQSDDPLRLAERALPLIQKLVTDADPHVRSAAQGFLANFVSEPSVADNIQAALSDPDQNVRSHALWALKTSEEPPPMATLEKAFVSARGEIGIGLIELMVEREDSGLAARLTPAFNDRTTDERLMIMTAIAGHSDEAALGMVALGLKDKDSLVCRAALMRLLEFPTPKALSLIKENKGHLPASLQSVAAAVEKELQSRTRFPFLGRPNAQPVEAIFPSRNGTEPMVSPDGKWIAYVETGWGRPWGTGGTGRSNLLSITHVVRSDGTNDRVVSDMFLVGWMSDSQRLASARDGYATIVNVDGKTVDEFGYPVEKQKNDSSFTGAKWTTGEIRQQMGLTMPHSKRFQSNPNDSGWPLDFDYGEDGAASPDGKWFGPRVVKTKWQIESIDGKTIELSMIEDTRFYGGRAFWSPGGEHIIIFPVDTSNAGDHSDAINPAQAFIIDLAKRSVSKVMDVDRVPDFDEWDYRKGRFNPWSKDGKQLTYIRNGQVWISKAEGSDPKQITFDKINKVFPTFSPDGSKIAYITFQVANRDRLQGVGQTNLWVVDTTTGLAAKITRSGPGEIQGIDWLDNSKLISDRISGPLGFVGSGSALWTISLK